MKNENDTVIEETETNAPANPQSAIANPQLVTEPDRVNRKSEIANSSERRQKGKVAHLPPDHRRLVNEMLDDCFTYKDIVIKLEELGHTGFFYQNIQRWKEGGYKHWLRAQEKREETMILAEAALELSPDPKTAGQLCEANEIMLALRNNKLLHEIDDWDADTLMGDKSKAYFQLARSVTQQLSERTRRERFKSDVEFKKHKQEISQEAVQKVHEMTADLTKEQRDHILDKIDEILGIRIDPATLPGAHKWGPQPSHANTQENGSAEAAHANTQEHTDSAPDLLSIPNSAITNPQSAIPDSAHANTREHTDPELPASAVPQSSIANPQSAIHQPLNSVPILNKTGIILAWASNDDSVPPSDCAFTNPRSAFPDALPFYCRGALICWFDGNAPAATHEGSIGGVPHHIPVLDRRGRIINWSKEPDGSNRFPPSPEAVPLVARSTQEQFAWVDQST